MGLDTTHNCWHGPYSTFNQWRTEVCKLAGYGELDLMEGFGGTKPWPDPKEDALVHLLYHSDCDGELEAVHCNAIAKRLEEIAPKQEGFLKEKTLQFILGLLDAAARNENVEFR